MVLRWRVKCILLIWLCCSLGATADAQRSSKVTKLQGQRAHILKRIEDTSRKLKSIKRSEHQETKRIKLIQEQVSQRKELIAVIGQEVQELHEQLTTLGDSINHLKAQEHTLLTQYANSLRLMQKHQERERRLLFLFSSRDIGEARLRAKFLNKAAVSISSTSKEIKDTRSGIERIQQGVNETHEAKEQLLRLRNSEKQALEREEQKRQKQVLTLQEEQKKLVQDLNKQRQQAARLEAQIQAQIAREIAAAEARQKRQGKKPNTPKPKEPEQATPSRRRAIAQGYIMDAEELKLSGSFAQNRGLLPMPIKGRYELVRRFGMQQHTEHSRISISNGGIDLKVYGNRNAYSVFDGVVSRVFVTSGFGQSVIIRHGNYLTVYSNLSSVSVHSGEKITMGSIVGTISSDDSSGRADVLHFQLWHERNKQNPELWIRRM